jgi:hypothetical protein
VLDAAWRIDATGEQARLHWVGRDAACVGSTLDEFALVYLAAVAITRKEHRGSNKRGRC